MKTIPRLQSFVCLLILRSAWALLRNSMHILLEGAPANASPEEIEQHLKQAIPGLANVRHVHVWMITSGKALCTLHVLPAPDADPRLLVKRVEIELRTKFDIEHSTIAIDWPDTAPEDCCLGIEPGGDHEEHEHADHDHAEHDHRHEGHKH